MRASPGLLLALLLTGPAWAQRPAPPDRPGPALLKTRPAPETDRLVLVYGRDVGFEAGGADALPEGPDYLTAADDGRVALYDVVRREVIVATPAGVRARFGVSPVDALLLPAAGRVAVLDGTTGRFRLYSEAGAVQGELQLPTRGLTGDRFVLEGTSLVAVAASGERREVAQIVGGRLVPPTAARQLPVPPRLQASGRTLRIGGETIEVPSAARVAGRLLGGRPPWVEIQVVRTSARGIQVTRIARRARRTVELPVGARSYVPAMDVAATPDGGLVYLEPRAGEVHVVWIGGGR